MTTSPQTIVIEIVKREEEINSPIEEAICYGFIPVPLHGKRPKLPNWTARTHEEARTGFAPGDNVGVLTGPPSNILVVDVDLQQRGLEVWNSWISAHGDPQTPCVKTGSGGRHYYFKYQDGFKSASKVVKIGDEVVGIDIKTTGGQVVYPGSIHPDSGRKYEWIRSPADVAIQPIPIWLLHKLQPDKSGDQIKAKSPKIGIDGLVLTTGEINNILALLNSKHPEVGSSFQYDRTEGSLILLKRVLRGLCPVCKREHDHENAFLAVQTKKHKVRFYCRRNQSNPLLIAILKPEEGSTFKKLMEQHRGQAGLAIEVFGENIEVADPKGPIYLYDDNVRLWKEVTIGQFSIHLPSIILPLIKKEKDERFKQIAEYQKKGNEYEAEISKLKDQLSELSKQELGYNHVVYVRLVTEWLTAVLSQKHTGRQFDDVRKLLPVRDKLVVNMETGESRERERDDRFTYEIQIYYRPGKRSEFLDKFMSEIMLEDHLPLQGQKKVLFLRRLMGYAITGDTKEQVMPVLSGDGSNGKSSLGDLLRSCFPEIVKSADKSIIMKRNSSSSANSELHMLRSCRLALVSETQADELIDEDTFKRMTGGDEIQSRNLYTNFVSWTPQFVPFMITNHVPKCSGDGATLRRILIFKFLARFVDDPRLPNERKINRSIKNMWTDKEVKEAFLAWIVQGSMDYYRHGLNPPQEIIANTEQYKRSMDSFEVFLKEDVDPESTAEHKTSSTALWLRYKQRCTNDTLIAMSNTAFGLRLAKTYRKVKSSAVYYYGVRLLDQEQQTLL